MEKAKLNLKQRVLVTAIKTLNPKLPKVLSGSGSSAVLGDEIKKENIKKLLIVTDNQLVKLGLLDAFKASLEKNKIEYIIFDEIQPDPAIRTIEKGFGVFKRNDCDGVVGFGGGSVMDSAKVIAARATNNISISTMVTPFMITKFSAPLFAVPTTAGTGSEVTIYAVISDYDKGKKLPVASGKFIPEIAAIDPDLMTGLPKHITASTGMDALTHAVEAYISIYRDSFPEDVEYCKKATKMVFDNLEKAYNNPKDIKARDNMGLASHYGGIAFRSIGIGYVHAIAHRLGEFYHIPHGLANAIAMPVILEYMLDAIYMDLSELAKLCSIEAEDDDMMRAKAFIQAIKQMNINMQIPDKVNELKKDDFDEIIKRALAEGRKMGSPVRMKKTDLKTILNTLLVD